MKYFKILILALLCFSFATTLPAVSKTVKTVSIKGLIYDLQHPDADRRIQAAKLLGENKIRAAVPALINASSDTNTDVRMAVLTALDQIRDPRAVPAYVKLTTDPNDKIRRKSIDALVHIYVLDEKGFIAGTKKVLSFLNPFDVSYNSLVIEPYVHVPQDVINALTDRLHDPNKKVRKEAVMTLGIFRASSALEPMYDALQDETEDKIKVEYFRSFYKIGSPSACRAILPFIQDPEKSVHDEAIEVSGLLRCHEAVDQLMDIYQSNIKERRKVWGFIPASSSEDLQLKTLKALAVIGDPKSAKLFVTALHHANTDFRIAAAEGLARIGNPKYLKVVRKARRRAQGKHFQLALDFALYRMGSKDVLNEMIPEIDSIRYGDQVFSYLIEFTPEEQKDLFPWLRAYKGKKRIKLIEALGMCGGTETLKELRSYTNDSDPEVASAALLAVRRIEARLGS